MFCISHCLHASTENRTYCSADIGLPVTGASNEITEPDRSMTIVHMTWWRHQMETFSALLVIYAGNSPVPGEFPAQRPVTRSFDVFFDLRLNKRLSKQSWGWWFETLSCPLWCHCNDMTQCMLLCMRRNIDLRLRSCTTNGLWTIFILSLSLYIYIYICI